MPRRALTLRKLERAPAGQLHQVADEVKKHFFVFDSVIPRNVRLSEAPSHGKPALLYDLKCAGSQAYLRLAGEIIQRLLVIGQFANERVGIHSRAGSFLPELCYQLRRQIYGQRHG